MIELSRSGRFTVILAAVAIAAIAGMAGVLLWQLRSEELGHAEAEAISLSHIIAEQTTRSFQGIDLAVDIVLERLEQAATAGIDIDDVAVHSMLRSRIAGMTQLRSIFLVDAAGRVRSSALSHPPPSFLADDRDYFLALKANPHLERFIGAPVSSRIDSHQTVFFARRMSAAKGRPPGIIVASVNLTHLESLYDSIRLVRYGGISLFLNTGSIVTGTSSDRDRWSLKPLKSTILQALAGRADLETHRITDGEPGILVVRRVANYPLSVAVAVSDREALDAWYDTAKLILIGAAANILLMLAATFLLLRRIRHEDMLEAEAQESSDQLRAMVNTAMDAIVTIDAESRIVVFNPAAQSLFGYKDYEILGQPVDRLIPARFRASHAKKIAGFRSSGFTRQTKDPRIEIVGQRADGSEFPIESTIARVSIRGKEMYTAILRDVGDQRRAENELRDSHRQLRELASSLQAIREEERTSIARELHDELGQQLLRLRMDLSWLSGRAKSAPTAIQEKVADMKVFVDGIVDAVRRVTTRLRPPLLDELGLAEAARWLLEDHETRTGIRVSATIAIDDTGLDEKISINLFRILQESLTNVAKHSDATEVHVSLTTGEGELKMSIKDNGKGTSQEINKASGYGLVGIRERAILLGGSADIAQNPASGFCLTVSIPLAQTNAGGIHT